MKKLFTYCLIPVLMIFFMNSCSDDFLKGTDKSIVTSDDIKDLENSNPEALKKLTQSLLAGIYNYMNTPTIGLLHSDFGWMSICHMSDIMTDDIAMHSEGSGMYSFDYMLDYWKQEYVRCNQLWGFNYTIIAKTNDLLNKISPDTQNKELQAILGQCHALRGFAYFNLAQLFQQTYVGNENAPGMPLYLATFEGKSKLNRVPLKEIFSQIDADFNKAMNLLDGWNRPSKVQIDKAVAAGLFARVCLVENKWDDAAKYAKLAQSLSTAQLLTSNELINDGFNNIASKEWMWGADITGETATMFASFFSFICSYDAGYGGDVGAYRKIDYKLFTQMGASDVRRNQFKDPAKNYSGKEASFPAYTNLKFKKVSNWQADYVFMRKAEMILIEAEAYTQKNDFAQAAVTLKTLMTNRDPSWNLTSVSIEEVYKQRRLELWGEGFSLFDRMRLHKGIDRNYTGSNHYAPQRFKVDAGSWYFLFQIPLREIQNNSAIKPADQNPSPSDSEKVRS